MTLTLLPFAAGCDHSSTSAGKSAQKSASSVPTPTSTKTPNRALTDEARSLKTVKVPVAVRRQAKRGTTAYLAETTTVLTDPASSRKPSTTTVTGSALRGLLETQNEYKDQKYRVKGTPRVVSQRIVKRLKSPQRLVVLACVDSSHVSVLDKHGHKVVGSDTHPRSLNLITLVRKNGRWVVSATSFPNDPDC